MARFVSLDFEDVEHWDKRYTRSYRFRSRSDSQLPSALQPPSTASAWPLTKPLSISSARKAIARAISSGLAKRAIGIRPVMSASVSSCRWVRGSLYSKIQTKLEHRGRVCETGVEDVARRFPFRAGDADQEPALHGSSLVWKALVRCATNPTRSQLVAEYVSCGHV